MIQPKKYLAAEWKLTNYQNLLGLQPSQVLKRYTSWAGAKGIGKSLAILHQINQSSKTYPIFYIELKWAFGGESIEDRIKKAIKLPKIFNFTPVTPAFTPLRLQLQSLEFIRDHHKFSFIAYLFPLAIPLIYMSAVPLGTSWFAAIYGPQVLYGCFAGLYLWGVYPLLKYCRTRYIPTVVFDDAHNMALNQDPLEVQKCGNFSFLVFHRLANVVALSSDSRTSAVLKSMPNARDAVKQQEVKYNPEYTYTQILKDGKADFLKMKKYFLKNLFAHKEFQSLLSNDIIRYFVNELKDRELTLREFEYFFDGQNTCLEVFNTFLNKFKEEVQHKKFQTEGLKQEKIKQIVKETCKVYDHQEKDKMIYTMKDIMIPYDKVKVEVKEKLMLNQLIRSLGVEAQNAQMKPFQKNRDYLSLQELFIQYNILKQEKQFVVFESKMKKIAFKLWFEQVGLKQIEKDELELIAAKNKKP